MRVSIPTPERFALDGLLDGEGAQGVVVCHPHPAFGGTQDTPLVAALGGALAGAGLCALRFNFRGIGGSGGSPTGGVVEERDVVAAVGFLRARGATGVAVAGYSFGALMAAKAIARGLAVRAFAAIGFPSTIVGHHPERIADVTAALAAVPSLLLSGTEDQFSELPRLREWAAGRPTAKVVALPGMGHFLSGPALDDVVARAVAFLVEPG